MARSKCVRDDCTDSLVKKLPWPTEGLQSCSVSDGHPDRVEFAHTCLVVVRELEMFCKVPLRCLFAQQCTDVRNVLAAACGEQTDTEAVGLLD